MDDLVAIPSLPAHMTRKKRKKRKPDAKKALGKRAREDDDDEEEDEGTAPVPKPIEPILSIGVDVGLENMGLVGVYGTSPLDSKTVFAELFRVTWPKSLDRDTDINQSLFRSLTSRSELIAMAASVNVEIQPWMLGQGSAGNKYLIVASHAIFVSVLAIWREAWIGGDRRERRISFKPASIRDTLPLSIPGVSHATIIKEQVLAERAKKKNRGKGGKGGGGGEEDGGKKKGKSNINEDRMVNKETSSRVFKMYIKHNATEYPEILKWIEGMGGVFTTEYDSGLPDVADAWFQAQRGLEDIQNQSTICRGHIPPSRGISGTKWIFSSLSSVPYATTTVSSGAGSGGT